MSDIEDIKDALARNALAVCQTYLPNGRRSGNYWIIGDINGNKGKSLYVRLNGRAGKWTDSATAEHGDLLDIIKAARGFTHFKETLDEARRFLAIPQLETPAPPPAAKQTNKSTAARRLFAASKPIFATQAERYLRARAITGPLDYDALRFHPRCYHYTDAGDLLTFPALIAAITDPAAKFAGLHRTWLDPDQPIKAPIEDPRRAMGNMIGNAVRFGNATDVLIAGEGLETVLSLRDLIPWIPAVAALTANHLALLTLPLNLSRLYVARDNDAAGDMAWEQLSAKARAHGISPFSLIPALDDWNTDLRRFGPQATRQHLMRQLHPIDLKPQILAAE